MCASVIGKPDPQTEKLLEAIFGFKKNEKTAAKKEPEKEDKASSRREEMA
jgi:hypothetical protein